MDPQETAVYQVILVAALGISGILIYSLLAAVQQQARHRRTHTREIESEILARETERRRIAADMHDDFGALISVTKMALSGMDKKKNADAVLFNKSMGYLDEISGKVRALARGLMPTILNDKGLVMALQEFIKNLNTKNNPAITLTAGQLPELNQHATIHLYRILQEIIHNTLKHAKAKRVHIQIRTEKNHIILATADDGIGFNVQKAGQQLDGYGLTGIQSRVQLLNGNVSLDTTAGTRYYIEIPFAGNTVIRQQDPAR